MYLLFKHSVQKASSSLAGKTLGEIASANGAQDFADCDLSIVRVFRSKTGK
jgi:hypothetical protein